MEVPTMFDRIAASFDLARSSWLVLRRDKRLVLFPALSGIGCLLVTISFAVPLAVVAAKGGFDGVGDDRHPPAWTYAVAFAFYFCNYFVIVFCNAALISCALVRFGGEEPVLADGFRAAAARLPQILAWSLVSATVGVVLKVVENAHEKAGQFVSALLGTAWTVVTYFVVPVLVVEKVGPMQAVRRSLTILKSTWGEALVGHWGLGLFIFLLTLPGILLLVAGIALCVKVLPAGLALAGLAVVYLLVCAAAGSALNTIFLSALYQYAAFNQVPAGFEAGELAGAFTSKK
jgi:hypothetical protein